MPVGDKQVQRIIKNETNPRYYYKTEQGRYAACDGIQDDPMEVIHTS